MNHGWTPDELSRIDLVPVLDHLIRSKLGRNLATIKHLCDKDGTPFDVKVEDLAPYPLTCPVLGIPINWMNEGKGAPNDSPSLDRMVPELGYVRGNVRIISQKANRLKSNATKEDLERILAYMKGGI